MIRTDIFEKIKSDIPLEECISHYGVDVKKHKCLCIFHNDRSPSMSIKGNHFKCFSCGAGGDIFDWVQRRFRVGLIEAARMLCSDFNLPYMNEDLSRHDLYILKQQEQRRRAARKIEEIKAKKKEQKYLEALDEYRELQYLGDEPLGTEPDKEFADKLFRKQYLGYVLDHNSQDVIDNIDEVI